MPYATKAQIERARQPDLLTFLRRYKPDELIPTGPGAYKLRSHDSLKISHHQWKQMRPYRRTNAIDGILIIFQIISKSCVDSFLQCFFPMNFANRPSPMQ